MRTRGRLIVNMGSLFIDGEGICIADMDSATDRTTPAGREANARHIAACWNVVEAAGGDLDGIEVCPKGTLDALRDCLTAIEKVAALAWYTDCLDRDSAVCSYYQLGQGGCRARDGARAILDAAK